MRRAGFLVIATCLAAAGCGSFMENIVPAGEPTWKGVADAAETIHKGTPKWVVKMKLGMPTASGPRQWQYTYYGDNIAEATIYFDENDRVTEVKTSSDKELQRIRIRRR